MGEEVAPGRTVTHDARLSSRGQEWGDGEWRGRGGGEEACAIPPTAGPGPSVGPPCRSRDPGPPSPPPPLLSKTIERAQGACSPGGAMTRMLLRMASPCFDMLRKCRD